MMRNADLASEPPAASRTLELTETSVIENPDVAAQRLAALEALGVRPAIAADIALTLAAIGPDHDPAMTTR